MAGEAEGEIVVPPTLHALLAARLDQLEPGERRILECGAIEGEIFHRGAIQALAPEETQVTPRLAALVRKELIRPDRPQIAGEDGFRFRHLLIRDAAYEALPKSARADLHQRLAAWLEAHGTELVELDEILGYHLEQALAYRVELGLPDDAALMAAAGRRLTAAGSRALARQDFGAAARLLGRAVALLPPTEIDVPLELHLAEALSWTRAEAREALRQMESLAERAAARGDRIGELCGRLQHGIILMYIAPEGATGQLDALAVQALPELLALGDDVALHTVYQARGWAAFGRGRTDSARDAYDLAALHARRAGLVDEHKGWRSICRLYGTTPIAELLTWLDANESRARDDHWHRTRGRWPLRGKADSTKHASCWPPRGRSSPSAAAAFSSAGSLRSSRTRWSSSLAMLPPPRSSEHTAAACSSSSATRGSSRARLRVSPRRSTDSTGSTRHIRGRRARPSSARATTPSTR